VKDFGPLYQTFKGMKDKSLNIKSSKAKIHPFFVCLGVIFTSIFLFTRLRLAWER